MSRKYQLSFSKKYSKLQNPVGFSTVRWPDAVYQLGKPYNVVYVCTGNLHRSILGTARVVKAELVKLGNLTPEFMRKDADCSREEYFELMQGWYQEKPDWLGWNSRVQLLSCEWIYLDQKPQTQKQLVEAPKL